MKKLICCLVLLFSFALVAPAGFASPCTSECYATFYACEDWVVDICIEVCGPPDPYNVACWEYFGVNYFYPLCKGPLIRCLDECQ